MHPLSVNINTYPNQKYTTTQIIDVLWNSLIQRVYTSPHFWANSNLWTDITGASWNPQQHPAVRIELEICWKMYGRTGRIIRKYQDPKDWKKWKYQIVSRKRKNNCIHWSVKFGPLDTSSLRYLPRETAPAMATILLGLCSLYSQ